MKRLISYRPGVIGHNTAFEAIALIYKHLQQHYGYHFTIMKSSTDQYEDAAFQITNLPSNAWALKASNAMNAKQTVHTLLREADGILTVDPTIYGQGVFAIKKAASLQKPVWFDTSLTIPGVMQTLDWRLKRRFVLRKTLEQTTGIIATVPKCLERFQDLGLLNQSTASKFTIMGHPVDVTKFVPGTKRSQTDGLLRVLVASRMVPEKGLLYILEAMVPILKACDRVQLQLLGSGLLRSLLEREVAKHGLSQQVVLLEPVPHSELPRVLGEADIFVNHALTVFSWEEYFGAVNLEAMACELPCVLTRSGGIPYAIREQDVALFVEERNTVQLRQTISQLLSSERERVELGKRARSYVKDYYGLPVIAEQYHQMLQRGFAEQSSS